MTKKELLEAMAKGGEITQAQADAALSALIDSISSTVAKGDKVAIPGLGTFQKTETAARKGRNPQTGKEIDIPAGARPSFKAATAFKDQVNTKKKK